MAKQGGNDLATDVMEFTFTQAAASPVFTPTPKTDFNIVFTGAGTGSVQLECSFDDGANWCILSAAGTQMCVWTYSGTKFAESWTAAECGIQYRLNCTSFTSSFKGRLSQ